MKELGITSLNIISNQSATLNSNEFGIIQIFFKDKSSRIALESSPMSSSTTKTTTHISKSLSLLLSALAIKMAKNLHKLLLYIDNLPTVPPTINSMNTDINSYTQKLLNKLSTLKKEEFEAEIENQASYLKFLNKSTHDTLQKLAWIAGLLLAIPLAGLVYFSAGFGRLGQRHAIGLRNILSRDSSLDRWQQSHVIRTIKLGLTTILAPSMSGSCMPAHSKCLSQRRMRSSPRPQPNRVRNPRH